LDDHQGASNLTFLHAHIVLYKNKFELRTLGSYWWENIVVETRQVRVFPLSCNLQRGERERERCQMCCFLIVVVVIEILNRLYCHLMPLLNRDVSSIISFSMELLTNLLVHLRNKFGGRFNIFTFHLMTMLQ